MPVAMILAGGGIRLRYCHELEEAGTMRIGLDAARLTPLPKTLQHLATDKAKVAQVAIA